MANQAARYEAPTGIHDGRDLPAATQEDSPESVEGIWAAAVQVAIVGIFVITLGACLFFCRPVLLPVTAALVVGMTLAPLVKAASRHRIPPWLTAGLLGVALLAASAAAVSFLGKPFTDWIGRAPEIVINFCLGVVVSAGAYAFGFPSPLLFGILAVVLNYIPYIGAGCMTVILFGIGLVSFPSLGYAIIPPAAFVALATLEGQFITPTVLGRRLTLNPLAVLLALAFWAWIWGPMGAFLAVPLTIVGLVTLHHLFPADESRLPG